MRHGTLTWDGKGGGGRVEECVLQARAMAAGASHQSSPRKQGAFVDDGVAFEVGSGREARRMEIERGLWSRES